MDRIFNEVCVLVTAAFAFTLVPGFRQPARSLLSRRDQGTSLLDFMSLGLLEEVTASHAGWLNERIVAVCAGGLLAGPWVGLAVSVFVTWLAVAYHGLPLGSIGLSMLLGGLAGGWLHRCRPRLAQQPLTGAIPSWIKICTAGPMPGVNRKIKLSRKHEIVAVKQNPVRGSWASLGRRRYNQPPTRAPLNIVSPRITNGRPS